jgi:hypothetical protein
VSAAATLPGWILGVRDFQRLGLINKAVIDVTAVDIPFIAMAKNKTEQKERILRPLFQRYEMDLLAAPVDTNLFGTFSGERPRILRVKEMLEGKVNFASELFPQRLLLLAGERGKNFRHPPKLLAFPLLIYCASWEGQFSFLHLNLEHFFMNALCFIPISLMIERKNSVRGYLGFFFLIHLLTLILLIFWSFSG